MRATAIGLVAIILTITVAWTSLNASANTSGPNASGYTWTDSNAPAPFVTPTFIDITTTGTMITAWSNDNDDDGISTQPLPFPFNFFGDLHDAVNISTNGFISLDTSGLRPGPEGPFTCNDNYNWDDTPAGDEAGYPIPHDDADCSDDGWGFNPLIAAFFDDLDPSECGEIYYGTNGSAPNRMFIVQWEDVCHNDCSGANNDCEAGKGVTFEVILYEGSNDIRVQYADGFFSATMPLLNNGASATSGLSFDGSTGLPYSHAEPRLINGLAVLYQPGTAPSASPSPTPSPTVTPVETESPTPTETPAGQAVVWGDANCSGGPADPIDSLLTLRSDAGLSANTGDCPALGTTVDVADASLHVWGDVDCSSAVDPVDSLKILRVDAGLGITQEAGCPAMGQQVQITPQ